METNNFHQHQHFVHYGREKLRCSTMTKRKSGKCWYVVGCTVVGSRIYDSREWDWLHLGVSLRALGFFGIASLSGAFAPAGFSKAAGRAADARRHEVFDPRFDALSYYTNTTQIIRKKLNFLSF